MFGFVRGGLWGALFVLIGWIGGSLYPAPDRVTAPIAERMPAIAARLGVDDLTMARLGDLLSKDQFARLRREATELAAAAGESITIERDDGPVEEQAVVPIGASMSAASAMGAAVFEDQLRLCPRMSVANAPAADASGRVRGYAKIVRVNGVAIAINPTLGACLASAFGARGGRMHKGLDLLAADGGPVFAGADGVVIERKYRDDYGNMLLIDHGNGVYTRYAHLSNFAIGVVVGADVVAGQRIGLMGNTASYQIPIHLHYELLLGDYANPRGSFGLTPRSPFGYPRAG